MVQPDVLFNFVEPQCKDNPVWSDSKKPQNTQLILITPYLKGKTIKELLDIEIKVVVNRPGQVRNQLIGRIKD